MGFWIQITSG